MALNDALDQMRAYAARGRIGEGDFAEPRLRLTATACITRGGVAFVSWHAADARETTLVIRRAGFPPQQFRVPMHGRRKLSDLPVGRHTVHLLARPGRLRGNAAIFEETAVIEVVHPRPSIEIVAPGHIMLGEPLRLSWRIREAQRAEITTSQGRRQIEFEDATEIRPTQCGGLRFTFRAVGDGGVTERVIFIAVQPPPVVVNVPPRVIAEFGEDIAIRYSASGATALTLTALNRDEPERALPLAGRIEMDEITEPERLLLVATGHDGRTHSKTITVRVVTIAQPAIDDFLEILNGRR